MAQLIAVVPAAGGGARFGASLPKQYASLDGTTVLECTLRRLQQSMPLDATFVVLAPDDVYFDRLCARLPGVVALRCGGPTRGATVRNALSAIAAQCADDDWILVHDAARPCVPGDALERLRAHLADDAVGGLLAMPVADTLKRSDRDVDAPVVTCTEDRAGLWQAQTPQMFRHGVLQRAFATEAALACTDEAQAVEALGLAPRLIRGSPANIKITVAEDLALATAIRAQQAGKESFT
jgi:2-C-methyl-D-erythritol 4-phosphate cytidylyltransferase